jgi:4'-phosphopantetheinyl transferase
VCWALSIDEASRSNLGRGAKVLKLDAPSLRTPPRPDLKRDEVHLWVAGLDDVLLPHQTLESVLSEEELGRWSRFRHEVDRRRFASAHVFLRSVVGAYLGLAPSRVEFSRGRFGKPTLPIDSAGPFFNLSHSGDVAICGLADVDIGVDVERYGAAADQDAIAERWFSKRQFASWCALPVELRAQGFLLGWTQIEAVTKASGRGFLSPMPSLDLELSTNVWQRVGCAEEEELWWVVSLSVPGRFVVSVASQEPRPALILHTWQGKPGSAASVQLVVPAVSLPMHQRPWEV